MTAKHLYKASLNWYGETRVFHTWATSEKAALLQAISQLIRRLCLPREQVMAYFLYPKGDNQLIEKVK